MKVQTNNNAPEGWRGLSGHVKATCTLKGVKWYVVHIPRLNGCWRFQEQELVLG